MLPTEQDKFFVIITDAMGLYSRTPETKELMAWWGACKTLSLDDVERALKAHSDHPEEGKRAPRPIDVKRRAGGSPQGGKLCHARDVTGQCQYPGIFSDGTAGEGPWWCPWHREEHSGPEASRYIEASRNVSYETAAAKRLARMKAKGIRSPSAVGTSHDIAKRHGNKPWERDKNLITNFLPENLREPGSDG